MTAEQIAEFRRGGPVTTHSRAVRIEHQILAVCTLALAFSGFSLYWEPMAPLGRMLGGARVLGWTHRIAAVVLIVLWLYHVATIVLPTLLRALRAASVSGPGRLGRLWHAIPLLPTREDVRDAAHTARYFAGRERRDHPAVRWHYRGKFHYLAVLYGIPAMGLTGAMLALPLIVPGRYAALLRALGVGADPADVLAFAERVHAHEAILVVAISIGWHFYRMLVPPRLDIVTGRLTLDQLRRWHPRWYADLERAAAESEASRDVGQA